MQIKEALEFWKFRYKQTKDYNDIHWEASERREHEEYVEALKSAIEALEKQIPKKVIKNEGYWEINCPYCLTDIAEEKGNEYCVICGQALDWSDDNAD